MSDNGNNELTTISRREAQSGKISYGSPIILHESTRTRQVMIPFYVRRTSGVEVAVKIQTYRKAPPPMDWNEVEDKSISLNQPAAQELLRALRQHFAVAQQDEDGNYVVIKVGEEMADIADLDPGVAARTVADLLTRKDLAQHLTSKELGSELISSLRIAMRLQELLVAVAELRNQLDTGVADEKVYQEWCEQHTWAFGNAYVVRDEIRQITAGDTLDVLIPTVIAGYRDIIELKRPDKEVILYDTSHRNYYFSADVSKAIGQCHRYLDVLAEEARDGLRDYPDIVAYHPRATIVIGRSVGWDQEKRRALHGLNDRLHGISVITYDQLLAQGERLVEILGSTVAEEDPPDLEVIEDDEDF